MTSTTTVTELYAAVQLHYARQVQLLDGCRFAEYAATFTADGEFQHTPGQPAAHGHDGITAELTRFNKRFDNDPVQRRHWFNMIDVRPREDGLLDTTFYALVLTTRPGVKEPVVGPSCLVRDVLAFEDGELRNRSRQVHHDQMS
ncbi:nuclear transport factor 2 family protein [Saccharopolyspora shandongensis]|uniref:Actinorhodin biosynthesis protein ActVIA n=1 Tax=Saccharopolyspora shandongensis TaxID=418495 RepID=A0A1H2R333_9PSEU|nr:nuclear transport factor 2 family protein [Saccharopolyspora shandongensis]SDW13862.1 actinorhodin biosynthesis protein ActVIA [Saccharopolyspora shandongensis]